MDSTKTQMTKTKKITTLADSLGPNPTYEKNIPNDQVWIDGVFFVTKTRFGLYTSVLRQPFGAHFITGVDEDLVLQMTRNHLKSLQDGTLDDDARVVNTGVVGGKL